MYKIPSPIKENLVKYLILHNVIKETFGGFLLPVMSILLHLQHPDFINYRVNLNESPNLLNSFQGTESKYISEDKMECWHQNLHEKEKGVDSCVL